MNRNFVCLVCSPFLFVDKAHILRSGNLILPNVVFFPKYLGIDWRNIAFAQQYSVTIFALLNFFYVHTFDMPRTWNFWLVGQVGKTGKTGFELVDGIILPLHNNILRLFYGTLTLIFPQNFCLVVFK